MFQPLYRISASHSVRNQTGPRTHKSRYGKPALSSVSSEIIDYDATIERARNWRKTAETSGEIRLPATAVRCAFSVCFSRLPFPSRKDHIFIRRIDVYPVQ